MTRATPEMIAAAWAAWHSRHGGKLGPGPAFVEAINAALAKQQEQPAMTQQEKTSNPAPVTHLRVKPLEWRALDVTDREAAVADSILGKWEVWQFPNGSTYIMKPGEHQGTVYEDSYDEAKAYLERAYQRRISPALTTEGQPDV